MFKVITDKYDPVAIYFIVLGSSLICVSCLEKTLYICWRAGLVVLNSLSLCLSEKLLISPSCLNEILAGYSNLGCRLLSFITLSMSCLPFWLEEFLLKDQLLSLWGSPCVKFVAFPLLLLIFALCVRSSLI